MRKILKEDKLYSLAEFRDKLYDDLDLSRSDLATLLCAMLIASIGLNMDSTPVIIGAMLISPLMTPIIGIGFSLAILDMKLLRKSFKILSIQVLLSLLASTIYFFISFDCFVRLRSLCGNKRKKGYRIYPFVFRHDYCSFRYCIFFSGFHI